MSTLQGFVWVLIPIVFEFVFRCRCVDPPEQLKKCYEVGYNTFCFFRPACEYRWMTWKEAWQTCNRYNATLPAIPNQAAQKNFENYTKFLKPTYLNDFWMAGQEVRGLEWKWLNDSTANLYFESGSLGDDDVQGVLTKSNRKVPYTKDNPSKQNHFFCQMNGTACQSNGWISLSNGCVSINRSEVLNFYDARNRCVKDGADLAVIDNEVDRQRLNEVITRIPNVTKVWIGLRRQWWTWNATDPVVEMKYSNWRTNHGFKSNQTCMIVEMKRYKWQQESCDSLKHLVCQTVAPTLSTSFRQSSNHTTFKPISFVAIAVCGISISVVTIILVVVIRKQRKAREQQIDITRVASDRSYQDLHDRQENNYAELQGITHQQSEVNSDYQTMYDYDDVGVTRIPSYLNIVP